MRAAVAAVIVVLGLVALAVVGGAVVLALDDRPPLPTEIAMIGGAAVTGLAAVGGVLAVVRPQPKATVVQSDDFWGQDTGNWPELDQPDPSEGKGL